MWTFSFWGCHCTLKTATMTTPDTKSLFLLARMDLIDPKQWIKQCGGSGQVSQGQWKLGFSCSSCVKKPRQNWKLPDKPGCSLGSLGTIQLPARKHSQRNSVATTLHQPFLASTRSSKNEYSTRSNNHLRSIDLFRSQIIEFNRLKNIDDTPPHPPTYPSPFFDLSRSLEVAWMSFESYSSSFV